MRMFVREVMIMMAMVVRFNYRNKDGYEKRNLYNNDNDIITVKDINDNDNGNVENNEPTVKKKQK